MDYDGFDFRGKLLRGSCLRIRQVIVRIISSRVVARTKIVIQSAVYKLISGCVE